MATPITITEQDTRVDYEVTATPDDTFDIPFEFFETSDIRVSVGGVEKTSGFTVTGTSVQGGFSDGTLTLDSAVSNTTVSIWRDIPLSRTSVFPTSGEFSIVSLNTQLARIVAMIQQMAQRFKRGLRLPEGEGGGFNTLPTESDRAETFFWWDGDGQPTTKLLADLDLSYDTNLTGLSSNAALRYDGSEWVNEQLVAALWTFLKSADLATARTNLGLSGGDAQSNLGIAPAYVFATVGTANNAGAAGDGDLSAAAGTGTNDVAALTALAEEIRDAGGGTLDLQGKTYRVDASDGSTLFNLASFENVTVRNGTFDARNHSGGGGSQIDIFGGGGSIETSISLSSDAVEEARSLDLSSALDANDGDWLLLESDDNFDKDGTNDIGELVRTSTNSSSTSITLRESIDYAYLTSQDARVSRINFVENICFEDLYFFGNTSEQHNAIDALRCLRLTVRRCRFTTFNSRCVGAQLCAHVHVENILTEKSYNDSTNYGVVFTDGTHYGYVTGCTFHGCRHGVSTGGSKTPNRHLVVDGNTCIGAIDAAIDSHRGCDHITVSNNHVNTRGSGSSNDGILIQAARTKIIGNTITGNTASRNGIFWQPLTDNISFARPSAVIANNQLEGSGEYAIRVDASGSGLVSPVSITGNVIACQDKYTNGIALRADTADIYRFTISGNSIERVGARAILIQATTGQVVSRGCITGNHAEVDGNSAECIYLSANGGTMEDIAVTGNSTQQGEYGIEADDTDWIIVVGNVCKGSTNGIGVNGANSLGANNISN
jgi:hypothetical protein